MLPQWHIKDHGHSARSVDARLHLNTHTRLTQWTCSGLTMLFRRSVGREASSHATDQGRFGHGCLISSRWATVDWSWFRKCSWCALISTLNKSARGGWFNSNLSPKPSYARKSHHKYGFYMLCVCLWFSKIPKALSQFLFHLWQSVSNQKAMCCG